MRFGSRYCISAVILLLSVSAAYPLCCRLIAEIHCYKAEKLRDYKQAEIHLKTAADYQPDDYRIQKELGKIYLRRGQSYPNPGEKAFFLIKKSKDFYLRARRLNPLDAETIYELARAETCMEFLYSRLYPEAEQNPYHPRPYFEEAVRLKPNGILYHYGLVLYLSQKKLEGDLLKAVRGLCRNYPPVYAYLKKEVFWSETLGAACEQGLEDALGEHIMPRHVRMIIASIKADKKDWTSAIFYYKSALNYKTFENHAENHISLGRLYLKKREPETAEKHFFHALKLSESKEKTMEQLYSLYKDEGNAEKFYPFYRQARQRFALSFRTDILAARSLADLQQYREAREILTELNRKNADAEAYYRLACISEAEKDWERMDIEMQKATVLDPKNSRYYLKFAEVLTRLNHLADAEKAADAAIFHQAEASPWLLNQRAWIRRKRQNYSGAIEDWKAAIRLKADNAGFYAGIADVCYETQDWRCAWEYYEKALSLSPENVYFQDRKYKAQSFIAGKNP